MPLIIYKFADGHTEEIEVSDEVAAAFAQLEKYEKKGIIYKIKYKVSI